MKAGFAKIDITPRVGVELSGFGPYLNRHSIGVRDRIWARAMAVSDGERTAVVLSCDLVGLLQPFTDRVRQLVTAATGVPGDAVMVHCIHTHSAPAPCPYVGWGDVDQPYLEILPYRLARAAAVAIGNLTDATLAHGTAPCEHLALNREYDRDAPPLEEVLREDWRPAKPELTDTLCHVLRVEAPDGRLLGFASYYGCHPVVCCETTRYVHGDYAGVATNLLEREYPGSVGLFLQGAEGDVNSCVVHKPEAEALLALDVIAGRYARAVRAGLHAAEPLTVDAVRWCRRPTSFSRRPVTLAELRHRLAEQEARFAAPEATDADRELRMAVVYAQALRGLIRDLESGVDLQPKLELYGLRLGPVALLASPFEVMQAIKNEVVAAARAPIPLVMGLTGDSAGYAADRNVAARSGYAQDIVPFMLRMLPYARIHDELVAGLLQVDAELWA